jgi:hypothetical protein
MKQFRSVIFALICLTLTQCSSQRIEANLFQTWSSTEGRSCITIAEKGSSYINELQNVQIIPRGQRLKIVEFSSHPYWLSAHQVYWFDIVTLNSSELIIRQDLVKNNYYEQLPDSILRFVPASRDSCGHNPALWNY